MYLTDQAAASVLTTTVAKIAVSLSIHNYMILNRYLINTKLILVYFIDHPAASVLTTTTAKIAVSTIDAEVPIVERVSVSSCHWSKKVITYLIN